MSLKTSLAKMLSPRLLGWMDYMFGRQSTFDPWGGPMNGQVSRQKFVADLVSQTCEQIVETGTYRGSTTEWFAAPGKPVLSVEANLRYFVFAGKRLAKYSNIKLFHEHSANFLHDLPRRIAQDRPTLFYLDAHWHADLPIRDELAAIFSNFPKAVIVIDDFRVPHDAGYGYDDYGVNGVLELAYIRDILPEDAGIYFPAVPAADETGARRGWAVISTFTGATAFCDNNPYIRRWTSGQFDGKNPP